MFKKTCFRSDKSKRKAGMLKKLGAAAALSFAGVLAFISLMATTVFAVESKYNPETIADGEYSIEVTIYGGSGKASVETPTLLIVDDGVLYAKITWSSSNYDYMIVDGTRYDNEAENEEANSTFTIPIPCLDIDTTIIADTTAMGAPHEIEYQFCFYGTSIGSKAKLPSEGAKRVLVLAGVIIVGGGILNHYVQKRRRMDYSGNRK